MIYSPSLWIIKLCVRECIYLLKHISYYIFYMCKHKFIQCSSFLFVIPWVFYIFWSYLCILAREQERKFLYHITSVSTSAVIFFYLMCESIKMKVTHVFTEEGIHPDKLGKRIYFICSHAPYYLNVRPETAIWKLTHHHSAVMIDRW